MKSHVAADFKVTISQCVLGEYVLDNDDAWFDSHSYLCCRETLNCTFMSKSLGCEMRFKVTRPQCELEEYAKENYYARLTLAAITTAEKGTLPHRFMSRLLKHKK